MNSAVKVPCERIWPEKSKRECSKWPIVICHAWYAIRWFTVVKVCRKSKNLNIAFDFLVGSLHNYLEEFIFALLKFDDCSSFHLIVMIQQWNLQGILKRMLFIGRFGPEADTPLPGPEAGTPPPSPMLEDTGNMRAVRILLECILVFMQFSAKNLPNNRFSLLN